MSKMIEKFQHPVTKIISEALELIFESDKVEEKFFNFMEELEEEFEFANFTPSNDLQAKMRLLRDAMDDAIAQEEVEEEEVEDGEEEEIEELEEDEESEEDEEISFLEPDDED